MLAGRRSPESWLNIEGPIFDFFDLKGIIEELLRRQGLSAAAAFAPAGDERFHPGRSATISVGERQLGVFGEIHPLVRTSLDFMVERVCAAEINLDALLAVAQPLKYRSISRFPATVQDIALLAGDEVSADQIARLIAANGGEYLEDVRLFDVYAGAPIPAGQRSLAFRLRFRAADRTLADKELVKSREKLLKVLERELGVTLRG